jgi:5'-3' exonuclease
LVSDDKGINWKNVSVIIKHLAKLENDYLIEEHHMREKYDKWEWKTPKTKEETDKIVQNFPIIYRAEEKYICPGSNGWECRYYKTLFDSNEISNICINFFEGLEWVYKYYIGKPIDWKWSYQYHYGPLFKDLVRYIPKKELIKKNRSSFSSDLQLVFVLPKTQQDLLPEKTKIIINKNYSAIYLEKYDFKWAYCRYFWESHFILPTITIDDLDKMDNILNVEISKSK